MANLHERKIARMRRPRDIDEPAWTALCAAIRGDTDAIRAGGLFHCEYEYITPVQLAVRENHVELAEFLLDAAGDPAYESAETLLRLAREREYAPMAAMIERKLHARFGYTPEGIAIAAAIRDRDEPRVRALLDARPEVVREADERGNRPLHWAVMTRQIRLIDLLLERGADIEARRPDGLRPVHLTNGDYHYRGWRDLPASAMQRHEVLIGYLLARGAFYSIETAARLGDLERVRELLDRTPEIVNALPTYSYYTGVPLRNAAAAGHMEVVKLLLARGADPNRPEPGIAPRGGALHAAIGGRHVAIARLLLEHGADPNAAVDSSGDCLFMAEHVGSPELVELLRQFGARRDPPPSPPPLGDDDPDPTPWWDTSTPPPEKITPRPNWLGIAALHRCAGNGDLDAAAVCLERGADIDAWETHTSSTPLGWAAREGRQAMVRWLLERGARRDLPEEEAWARPLAWARRRGHGDVAALLAP